jgi:hypothetical protein
MPWLTGLLKIAYAFCLDLLAFRLSFFALDAKLMGRCSRAAM